MARKKNRDYTLESFPKPIDMSVIVADTSFQKFLQLTGTDFYDDGEWKHIEIVDTDDFEKHVILVEAAHDERSQSIQGTIGDYKYVAWDWTILYPEAGKRPLTVIDFGHCRVVFRANLARYDELSLLGESDQT